MVKPKVKQSDETYEKFYRKAIWFVWLAAPILVIVYKLTGGHVLDGCCAGNKANYPWQDSFEGITIFTMFISIIIGVAMSIVYWVKSHIHVIKKLLRVVLSVVLPAVLFFFLYLGVPNLVHTDYSCDQWRKEGVDVVYCQDYYRD